MNTGIYKTSMKWILAATLIPTTAFGNPGVQFAVGAGAAAAAAAAARARQGTPAPEAGQTQPPSSAGTSTAAGDPAASTPPPVSGTDSAPAAVASDDQKLVDLSLADAKKYFSGFRIERRGTDPDGEVFLAGVAHKSCLSDSSHFKITNSADDAAISVPGMKGFRVQLSKGAIKCLDAKGAAKCEDDAAGCERLSRMAGSTLKLSNQGDGRIAFFSEPRGEDVDGYKAEAYEPAISFKSAQTLAAEAQKVKDEARKERVALYRKQVAYCRKSDEELTIARKALDSLLSEGQLKDGELAKITKALDEKYLEIRLTALRKAKLGEEDAALEELSTYASDHEEQHPAIAKAYYELIQKYAKAAENAQPQQGVQHVARARELTEEALDTLTLNDATVATLEKYLSNDLLELKARVVASNGWSNNMELQNLMQTENARLQREYQSACSYQIKTVNGQMQQSVRDMDRCQNAVTMMQKLSAIQQQAVTIERMPQYNPMQQQQAGMMPGQGQQQFAGGQTQPGQQQVQPGQQAGGPFGPQTGPRFGSTTARPQGQVSPVSSSLPYDQWGSSGFSGSPYSQPQYTQQRAPAGYY